MIHHERKISLFLPSLRGGGAERVMVNLARGFAERGLQVDLVLARAEGPYLSEVPESVRVVDLGSKRVLYSRLGPIRMRQCKFQSAVVA
ncbi:glycosyltransferase [Methanothrix sp.]|uniref:glycosyltransferase n=1 Tax=Methanothrix sp. TaxID=90426 RepID=UPI00257BF816|nr:glycosyltransferase [Methanothrix sp.]